MNIYSPESIRAMELQLERAEARIEQLRTALAEHRHTDECLRYAAKTGQFYCITECADSRAAALLVSDEAQGEEHDRLCPRSRWLPSGQLNAARGSAMCNCGASAAPAQPPEAPEEGT